MRHIEIFKGTLLGVWTHLCTLLFLNMSAVFVQSKFSVSNNVFTTLIDTGNTFRNLISFKAFKKLGIPLIPSTGRAFSVDNSDVKIVGKTPWLNLSFVNSSLSFKIELEIIHEMMHDVNLGYKFLSEHNAVLLFCENLGNTMCIRNETIRLGRVNEFKRDFVNEMRFSQPTTFEERMCELPGINYTREGGNVVIDSSRKFSVQNYEKVKVPPLHICPVRVKLPPDISGEVYITPMVNKKSYASKNGLLPLESVYIAKDNHCYINVLNTNETYTSIPKYCKIGFAWKCEERMLGEGGVTDSISNLDGLSTEELRKRIAFITEELKLKSNPLLANNSSLRAEIVKIFLDNYNAVAKNSDDIGTTNLINFKIDLKEGVTPVKARNFPLNPDQSAALRLQIDKWLKAKVIRPTISPWSSPIFSVKKKTSIPGQFDLRFVLDFRGLNERTKEQTFPIPNIESNLGKLGGGAQFYSTLDCVQAYHSVPVEKKTQEYLAFSGEDNTYCFTRMPFGCKASANVFQRLMNKALGLVPGIGKYCVSYLDDLIIFSDTMQEHLQHVKRVIEIMSHCGLKLKLSKCALFQTEVKYLGHIISSKSIKMDPYYLERVKAWVLPKTGKDMQSFLGFLNYYRSYLPQFAEVTYRLDELRNEKLITWTPELVMVFDKAKAMFHDSVSRGYPDWSPSADKFLLDIDWSKNYMSGILSQNQKGVEVLIGAFSRKCSLAESRYSSHKGEASALVYSLEKFSHFLRFRDFVVRTDSRSVLTTSNWKTRLLTGVTHRWLEYISTFSFHLVHRAGSLHTNADILSRTPCDDVNKIPPGFKIDPITKLNSEFEDVIFNVNSSQNLYHIDADLWVKSTNLDETLKVLKEWVLMGHKPSKYERLQLNYRGRQLVQLLPHLSVINGLLVFTQPTRQEANGIIKRTIVPILLYDTVFKYCHENSVPNHRGILNTMQMIQSKFCMPYCRKYITARVNNCVICFNKIKNNPKAKQIIQFSDFSSVPWSSINIDTIGPLTNCIYNGVTVKHILIIVDACTRYMWLHPLTDITTDTIVDAICDEFVPIFTLFKDIKSDRGPCFTSKIWKGVMDRFGIDVRHSVVRNPNSNFSERYNQNVYSLFKTDSRFMVGQWASKLKFVMLAYNSAVNLRTGFSPHFMLFKKDPVLPLDLIDPLGEDKTKLNFHSGSFDKFVYKMDETFKILKERTENYLNVENAQRGTINNALFVNNIVYFFEDCVKIGVSRKLSSFFLGPFIISHKFSDVLYELTPIPPNTCKRIITAARDKLRKVDGKVKLGDETVGFNIQPSKYINIDSDVQLKYLSDLAFEKNLQESQVPLHGEEYSSLSDSEDENPESDISIIPETQKETVISDEIVSQDNTLGEGEAECDLKIREDKTNNTPMNNNDTILVHSEPKRISGKSFVQLSKRGTKVAGSNKLSLRDLFSQRTLRSSPQGKMFSLDMSKPFRNLK